MKRLIVLAGITMVLGLAATAAGQTAPPDEPIIVTQAGISPEGIEWDSINSRFLLSSLSDGFIRSVDDAGSAEIFIQDEDVPTSVGIEVDEVNNRLLVVSSDSSVFFNQSAQGTAVLAAYDLDSGERLFWVDLGALYPDGRHFANDVTVDADGNAYVTDSFSPVLYRVDLDGEADIFIEDERLGSTFIGANGIDFHPSGFLLVANAGAGTLLKVPLDEPEGMTIVGTEQPLRIDGMVLSEDGTLYAVNSGREQALVALTSDDGWITAAISASVPTGGNATTVAVRDGIPFFINAYLNSPNARQYEIVPAFFE